MSTAPTITIVSDPNGKVVHQDDSSEVVRPGGRLEYVSISSDIFSKPGWRIDSVTIKPRPNDESRVQANIVQNQPYHEKYYVQLRLQYNTGEAWSDKEVCPEEVRIELKCSRMVSGGPLCRIDAAKTIYYDPATGLPVYSP